MKQKIINFIWLLLLVVTINLGFAASWYVFSGLCIKILSQPEIADNYTLDVLAIDLRYGLISFLLTVVGFVVMEYIKRYVK